MVRFPRMSHLPQTGQKLSDKVRAIISTLGQPPEIEWLRTGIHAFDLMVGDGIPYGRIIEIYGDESTGKSLLALEIAKAVQRENGVVVLFDTEATAPRKFMTRVGVNVDDIIHRKPETIEELKSDFIAIDSAFAKADPDLKICYIHDSVAATPSKGELEWDKKLKEWVPRDVEMGARARAMSMLCRHICQRISRRKAIYIAVNQVRDKIGVMFGEKTTTPGGRALRFHSSVRVQLNRGRKLMGSDQKYQGVMCNVFIKKNKVSEPFRKAPLAILWKKGFDEYSGLSDLLQEQGRIQIADGKPGWFKYRKLRFRSKNLPMILSKRPELLEPF